MWLTTCLARLLAIGRARSEKGEPSRGTSSRARSGRAPRQPLPGSGVERGTEGVADDLEDVAAVVLDDLAHQRVMPLEGCGDGLGMVLPALGRALDVGDEKVTVPVGGWGIGRRLHDVWLRR